MDEKILLVEDNPENLRLLEMILENKGYTLLKAIDGEEALNVARREHPDLILMDIQLPKMSGLEVTQTLRADPVLSDIIIIGITAYAMKGDKEMVIDSGCDAYMSKPFRTRELSSMIAEMLANRKKG